VGDLLGGPEGRVESTTRRLGRSRGGAGLPLKRSVVPDAGDGHLIEQPFYLRAIAPALIFRLSVPPHLNSLFQSVMSSLFPTGGSSSLRFDVGATYHRRNDLHAQFGGQQQGASRLRPTTH